MKFLNNALKEIKEQPIEEFRKEYYPLTVPHDQFYRIYALAVLLINIVVLFMVTFFPAMLTDTPESIVDLFSLTAYAAVFVSAAYPIFFILCNHVLKKAVYPRIRQDIKENPEMITRYKCTAPGYNAESLFIVAILLILDATVISMHPAFLPYQSFLTLSSFISVILPLSSAIICCELWERTFRKQILKAE